MLRRLTSASRARLAGGTAALVFSLLFAAPGGAVIIETGDGSGNVYPPPLNDPEPDPNPGFQYVGVAGGATGVYIRNGWVLTANHVSTGGSFTLGGVPYTEIPNSATRIRNPDNSWADLKVVQLTVDPGLPELPIRSNTALPTDTVYMIGRGWDRGVETDSDDPGIWIAPPLPNPPEEGFRWTSPRTLRWGTNVVEGTYTFAEVGTHNFYTTFDAPPAQVWLPPDTADESQGATGDSGGAVFALDNGSWELAGIMLYVANLPGQTANVSSLYDSDTIAADLSVYRQNILVATAVPEPSGRLMLGSGVLFLALVGRGRRGMQRDAARAFHSTDPTA